MMENIGSTNRPGYLYHEPAFEIEAEDLKFHRNDSERRLGILLRSQDWWNENVLDLGCNVGYFANKLALEGARTTGVDIDESAIALAKKQAEDRCLEATTFLTPGKDRRWIKDKDVLISFSVLPWIYKTEPDPDAYFRELFQIPVAYVEIQYPPDGRANIPGVTDDETCKRWLERFYSEVVKIGHANDETEGVVRKRSIWRCMNGLDPKVQELYGSQAIVSVYCHSVTKIRRENKSYSPQREAEFLKVLDPYDIAPKCIGSDEKSLTMTRIYGWPLTSRKTNLANLVFQFEKIKTALQESGISHNDVRPANLIVGRDYNVYLIDFGWATRIGEPKPEGVNPLFGNDDEAALEKILKLYSKLI